MKKTIFLLIILLLLVGCSSETDVTLPLTYDPGIDPDSWALVPAGEFLFGQFDEEVLVDYDYEIMVTHVTNAQYADYLNAALDAGDVKFDSEKIINAIFVATK